MKAIRNPPSINKINANFVISELFFMCSNSLICTLVGHFWHWGAHLFVYLSTTLPRSTAMVRQSVVVRFFIRRMSQRLSGMGSWKRFWVEFYSTPFVFFTDTFTGKVLCFLKLGWGHFLPKIIPQLRTQLVSLRPSALWLI